MCTPINTESETTNYEIGKIFEKDKPVRKRVEERSLSPDNVDADCIVTRGRYVTVNTLNAPK